MKKVVRTIWISLLSGLAFLVACTTPKGLSRAEKKQLKAERAELVTLIEEKSNTYSDDPTILLGIKQEELQLRERLQYIDYQLRASEEVFTQDANQIANVNYEIDSLNKVIKDMETEIPPCVYGPPADDPFVNEKDQRRQELTDRLEAIRTTIRRREGACVYGSPEVIKKYGEETRRLKNEAKEIEKELEELDNE